MAVEQVLDLDQLVARIGETSPQAGSTRITAIDGRGGAGKLTFSLILAEALGAEILETDYFASWENPLNWWPRLIEQVLEPLQCGRTARYQRDDWAHRRLGDWYEVQAAENLVLEGVSSSRSVFAPYFSFTIWIETPRGISLTRGIARDGEDMREQWMRWMREEDDYIAAERPSDRADVVISGAPRTPYDPRRQVVVLDRSSDPRA